MSKYGIFSGPYFPLVRRNAEIYVVNLRIQFEYGKIRTRRNSVFRPFYVVHVRLMLPLFRNQAVGLFCISIYRFLYKGNNLNRDNVFSKSYYLIILSTTTTIIVISSINNLSLIKKFFLRKLRKFQIKLSLW